MTKLVKLLDPIIQKANFRMVVFGGRNQPTQFSA